MLEAYTCKLWRWVWLPFCNHWLQVMILFRVATHQKVTNYPAFSLTYHWPLNSFHWPFINDKQSMFTIHFSFFLQATDIFLFIFSLFPLFTERGRRNWKKAFTTKTTDHNYYKAGVRRTVSNWLLCLPCSILFIFSKRKCISKSWRKLMNYKPENRIPWPFTHFDDIQDFPWLFPDLEKFVFSVTFPWLWQPCCYITTNFSPSPNNWVQGDFWMIWI